MYYRNLINQTERKSNGGDKSLYTSRSATKETLTPEQRKRNNNNINNCGDQNIFEQQTYAYINDDNKI